MMKGFTVVPALVEDEHAMCDIFLNHISTHTEYISHGEIQMGVGEGKFVDGKFVTGVSSQARHYWMKYIHGNMTDPEGAVVNKAVSVDGEIIGFCVGEIMEDGAEPFGMVCDVLVKESSRTGGVGTALLNSVLEWFRNKGIRDIYLESGLANHSAHEYFMRRGFVKVSEIYKLK
ncbi:MAG: GNAT family N-acetyltransferase [Bacteroidales bacterium]|nr:GNAT family N-acetyltransferase [Bacteroidales bacterium]